MNRFVLPLAAFALLVVVLFVGIQRSGLKGVIDSPLIGRPAPDFVRPNLLDASRPFDSRTMRGRWYALNVWGTWCPGCRDEHDVLLAAQAEGKLPIIGLDWKDEDAAALAWLADLGNPYEIVAVDRDGRVAVDYGVYGAPETFLIDPAGVIRHKHVGPLTPEVWQREFVARAAGPILPAATEPAT